VYLDGFGSAIVGPPGPPLANPNIPVPTLSEWALILLALSVAGVAALNYRGQRKPRA
jgi:hypothetical protein